MRALAAPRPHRRNKSEPPSTDSSFKSRFAPSPIAVQPYAERLEVPSTALDTVERRFTEHQIVVATLDHGLGKSQTRIQQVLRRLGGPSFSIRTFLLKMREPAVDDRRVERPMGKPRIQIYRFPTDFGAPGPKRASSPPSLSVANDLQHALS